MSRQRDAYGWNSGSWHGVLAHTVLGVAAGLLLLHPVTKAIYGPEWSGAESELERLALAFSPRMLRMSLAFAILGGALGLAFGLYNRVAARRRRVLDFLEGELARTVPSLLAAGESEHVEFKASARWDLEHHRQSRELEAAVARTIAGFLNHAGGSLILGVTDARAVCGLERDYQTLKDQNRDGFERFVVALVRTRLGGDICPLVHMTFHSVGGATFVASSSSRLTSRCTFATATSRASSCGRATALVSWTFGRPCITPRADSPGSAVPRRARLPDADGRVPAIPVA